MLRNLYRLLAPPSAHAIYRHRTRDGVINYWRQGANVLTVPLSTTPSEIMRKTRPLHITARARHMVPVDICAKPNCLFEKCAKSALSSPHRWLPSGGSVGIGATTDQLGAKGGWEAGGAATASWYVDWQDNRGHDAQ
jgi:hypothetical protein